MLGLQETIACSIIDLNTHSWCIRIVQFAYMVNLRRTEYVMNNTSRHTSCTLVYPVDKVKLNHKSMYNYITQIQPFSYIQ